MRKTHSKVVHKLEAKLMLILKQTPHTFYGGKMVDHLKWNRMDQYVSICELITYFAVNQVDF